MSESIARALTDNSIPADPALLRRLIASEAQRPTTRVQALRILAHNTPQNSLPWIADHLDSASPLLRIAALELLAELHPASFVQTVTERFSRMPVAMQQKSLALASRLPKGELDALIREELKALSAGTLQKELLLDVVQAANRRRFKDRETRRIGETGPSDANKAAVPKLSEALYGGDALRGEDLFRNHVNAQCVRCHDAGGAGKQAGPVLKGISSRATREYLLESLIDPSAKIATGFENVTVTLKNEERVSGQRLSEDANQIRIETSEEGIRAIAKAEIKKVVTEKLSSMPPMLEILTPFEIRDLIAYLLEL